jgi:hypothetical protein
MNEYSENDRLAAVKTASIRLARHGLQLVDQGDLEAGVKCVKVANALIAGYSLDDILKAGFPPQNRDKVASEIERIVETPSRVAVDTVKLGFAQEQQQKQAFDQRKALVKQAVVQKLAAQQAAQQQQQQSALQNLFVKKK